MKKMKKFIFGTMLFFLSALPLLAQVQIFNEDFDGVGGPVAGGAGTYAFPSGWTLINQDGRTPATSVSYVNDAWERREDFSFNVSDSCAFSTSWYSPAGAADDWMITPAIAIPGDATLSWNAVTYDATYPDGYEVWIGSAPTYAAMTAGTRLFSVIAENTAWVSRSVSLAAFAGQTVYIGFRNNSNDKFLLLIDDIKVEAPAVDIAMETAQQPTQYTIIPSSEITPLMFAGTVRNMWTSAVANARFQVRVKKDGVLVHNAFSNSVSSLAGTTTSPTLFATPYVPSGVGNYVVDLIAKMTPIDVVHANDTLRYYFSVDDYTYARDNGTATGALGIGAGNGGYLGQQFDVPNAGTVGSVSVYYRKGYTNNEPLSLAVWDMAGGVPNAIIAQTTPTTYYQGSGEALYVLPFSTPVTLSPETYVFTPVEYDSTLQVGQTSEISTLGSTWVNWPTNPFGRWANAEEFGSTFNKPFMIRPNFCPNNIFASVASAGYTCFSSGTQTASLLGGEPPYTYAWSNGATTPSISADYEAHTVTITDAYHCKWTATGTMYHSDNLAVNATPIAAGSYRATTSIVSNGIVTSTTSPVLFEATNLITLQNGFHAQAGSTFTARIRNCVILTLAEEEEEAAIEAASVVAKSTPTKVAQLEVRVVPNPMRDMATVRYFLPLEGKVSIMLYDINGRSVLTFPSTRQSTGWQEMSLDVSSLPKGFYVLSVATETERNMKKIVVAR